MRRLLIADIHANLPAFEAVLRDAGTVDEVVFLGDVVGYGPHPAACVDLLHSLRPGAILGNHDHAIISMPVPMSVAHTDVNWDVWTRAQLDPSRMRYLASLPETRRLPSCGVMTTLLHQLPGARYLHPAMPDAMFAEHMQMPTGDALYCGHSHRWIDRIIDGRRFVCLPAVGQPRNGDPRAGYVIEEDGALTVRYVGYDISTMLQDVRAIGLPETFCARWCRFMSAAYDHEWSRDWPAPG